MSVFRYFCLKFWICFCLGLVGTGCAAFRDTASTSELKSSPVALKTTSDSSEMPNQSADVSVHASAEEMLWQKLADADEETYVVLLRHAIAPGTGDPENFQLDDCSTQRNLSEAGRQQAREIGETFRDRNVAETQTNQVKDYIATNTAPGVIVMVTH